jgi:hypothetical protein
LLLLLLLLLLRLWLLLLLLLSLKSLFSAPMGKVKPLRSHFRSNSTSLNFENQPAQCGIRQIEIPHILEC